MRSLLVCAALLGACAAQSNDATIDIVFDPCEPLALVPGEGTTAAEIAGIDGALALWTSLRPWAITRTAAPAGAAAIPIIFQEAAHPFHGLYDDETGVVYINRDLYEDERPIAIAHELGHALGLFHIDWRQSIMNSGNLSTAPLEADAEDVDGIWGACAP